MSSRKAEIRRLVRAAERAGWRVEIGRKHARWYDASGTLQFGSSGSPSDTNAIKALARDLTRRGIDLSNDTKGRRT
jgi:hypothetical protein